MLASHPPRATAGATPTPVPGRLPSYRPRRPGAVSFVDALADHGRRPALLTSDGPLTYADLADRVSETSDRLGATRRLVLVAGANEVEAIVAYLGALRGGHPVLLAPAGQPHHLRSLVERYDPDVIIGEGDRAADGSWTFDERRDGSAHELHPDLALLVSTSGSTGSSKVVRLSHANVVSNAEAIARYLDIRPDDRAATSLPMSYCYGLSVVHSHLLRGAGLIVTDNSVVDTCFWEQFRHHGGTTFAGVPHTFDLLDRIDFASMELPHLRYVTQAGGRMSPERVMAYAELGERRGWDFVVMYGQTEATARMAYLPPSLARSRPSSIGLPIPGGRFEIDAPDGTGAGELLYRGPNVMLGYAESTADLAAGRTVGVLRTGDLARRAPDGLYEIVGRKSRFVKLFGLRVDLDQVERSLSEHGWSVLCAGTDDRLVVATTDEGERAAIATRVAEDLGLPPGVVGVHELGELPRLGSGKPDRASLVELDRVARASAVAHRPETTSGVDAAFASTFGRDAVHDTATFVGLGGDSLTYVEVSVRLEETLGYVPEAWHTKPIGDLKQLEPRRRRLRSVDTTALLRAIAIVLVVGSHTGLLGLRGGAHVLLAVAGYNFARFQLAQRDPRQVLRSRLTSIARVAVPSVALIAGALVLADDHTWANVALVNNYLADGVWRYWYWFVEVLVHLLVALTLLLSVPAVRRFEQRKPYWFATGFVALGLVLREISMGDPANQIFRTHSVLWLFALGWAAQRATSRGQRLAVAAVIAGSVPGFFATPEWDLLVVAGLLVVVWVPSVPVPGGLNRVLGAVAAASLYIYLTHWQTYPLLDEHLPPALVTVSVVAIGVAVWASVGAIRDGWARGRAALAAGRHRGRAVSPGPVW